MSTDELTILHTLDMAEVDPRRDLQDALLDRLLVELEQPPTLRDRIQLPRVRVRIQRLAIATAVVVVAAAAVMAIVELRDQAIAPQQPVIDQPPDLEPTLPEAPRSDALSTVLDARARWLQSTVEVHAITSITRVEEDGTSSTTQSEVWLRDEAAWRVTSTSESADGTSFAGTTIWDGARELGFGEHWVDGGPAAELTTYQATGRHPFGTPLHEWVASSHAWERRCADGEVLGHTEMAGRVADHVRCGQEELWLDVETGMLLRHERPADADDYDRAQQSLLVTSIDLRPAFAADAFTTEPPGDRPLSEFFELPHLLQPGDPTPPFAARTADGGPVDLEALRGEHVLVVFWSPGLFDLGVVEQVHRAGPGGLTVLVYDMDAARAAEHTSYMTDRGYTVSLVFDASPPTDGGLAPIAEAWQFAGDASPPGGMRLAQLWVLVGPEGDVVDTYAGNMLPEELEAWLTQSP